jgi:hypothetical protein
LITWLARGKTLRAFDYNNINNRKHLATFVPKP